MAAQFPANVPTFSTKTDFVDDILADHVNRLQEETVSFAQVIGFGVGTNDPRTPAVGGSGSTIHDRLKHVETNKSASTHNHSQFPFAIQFGSTYRTDYDGGTYWQGRRASDGVAWPIYLNWFGGGTVYLHDARVGSGGLYNDGTSNVGHLHSRAGMYATGTLDADFVQGRSGGTFTGVTTLRHHGTADWGTYPVRAEATSGSSNTGYAFHIPGVAAAIWKYYGGDGKFHARNSLDDNWITIKAFFENASSRRWKEDIQDLEHGLDTVLALQPRSFLMDMSIPDPDTNDTTPKTVKVRRIGFIAEEAIDVVPEVVSEDEEGPSGIQYDVMIAIAVKAIQQQQVMIEELQAQVAALSA